MIPAPFEYARAESVNQAIDLLSKHEDAKIIAGGHSLLPLMRLRLARPAMLVDISRIGDLGYIREDGDRIAIGAEGQHGGENHGAHSLPPAARACVSVTEVRFSGRRYFCASERTSAAVTRS